MLEPHLLQISAWPPLAAWDVIKENELRHPTTLDVNGEECLLVVKNGNSTDVTIGRATESQADDVASY
ncbi:hypothetical protein BDN67DRAFT_972155 [Paxillus ammoniavirescens]|nr:hypothetical protein BDN67DRAFT_972155 [Paxillus ammoniavirescens]